MNDTIYSAKEIVNKTINSLFSNIDSEQLKQANSIRKKWESILLSIRSSVSPDCGRNMLDHSRIIDIKDGIMIIEIDHPGWMQLFETYRGYILKGMKIKIPEIRINTISYKLKKQDEKNTARILTRDEAEYAIEKQNSLIKEKRQEQIEREIPPELKVLFSGFKMHNLD